MATLQQILSAARVELLEPRPQKPSYRYLLQLAAARIQHAHNEASQANRAWTIEDTYLVVSQGSDEYPLGIRGKILDVVYSDPANVEGTEYQVPLYDHTDLVGDFRGIEAASGIAFFYRNGELHARVRPIPQGNKTYRVSYSPSIVSDDMGLTDEPFLSSHHHYFVAATALDALPAAQWHDPESERGVKLNGLQRADLEKSLSRRVGEYYGQFKLGLMPTAPRVTTRLEAYPVE